MTNYAPSFTMAKLYEKTSQQDEGSRLRQKLVHLQYRAKLQEHITLAVTRIREDSAAANAKPQEIGAERPRKALELEGARRAVAHPIRIRRSRRRTRCREGRGSRDAASLIA